MNKFLAMAIGVVLLISIPGIAAATHLDTREVTADCDGWHATGYIYWAYTTSTADLVYTATLLDEGMNEIAALTGTEALAADGQWYSPFSLGDVWGVELCGSYSVQIRLELHPDNADSAEVETYELIVGECECDDEEPGNCFLTPGYWKNHARNWPQDTLVLGGVEMTQKQLIKILKTSVRGGDATVILAHHLIAAKLNVLNGADDSIQSVIDDADVYLADHPVFSDPEDDSRQYALDLKDMLADYNEQGCPEEEDDYYDKDDREKSATATESTSWDKMKAMYR